MTPQPRTLVLVRHAEAGGWSPRGDHERALTGHGAECAAGLGAWLATAGVAAELVLCSSARRTRQTWELARANGAVAASVRVLDALYEARETDVLRIIAEEADDAGTLVVVGHNPTIGSLAHELSDGSGDPEAEERLGGGFAPGTAGLLRATGSWWELGPGTATLERAYSCSRS